MKKPQTPTANKVRNSRGWVALDPSGNIISFRLSSEWYILGAEKLAWEQCVYHEFKVLSNAEGHIRSVKILGYTVVPALVQWDAQPSTLSIWLSRLFG